jgi:hypothetical protein
VTRLSRSISASAEESTWHYEKSKPERITMKAHHALLGPLSRKF